jgi:hypothetical protein
MECNLANTPYNKHSGLLLTSSDTRFLQIFHSIASTALHPQYPLSHKSDPLALDFGGRLRALIYGKLVQSLGLMRMQGTEILVEGLRSFKRLFSKRDFNLYSNEF